MYRTTAMIMIATALAGTAWAGNEPILGIVGKYPEEVCPTGQVTAAASAGPPARAWVSFEEPPGKNLVLSYFIIGLSSLEPGKDAGVLLRAGKQKVRKGTAGFYLEVTDSDIYHSFPFLKVQIKPSRSYRIVDAKSHLIGATDPYPWWAGTTFCAGDASPDPAY